MVTTPPAAAERHRFLALGDSYTIGEGVADEERWPAQLARRLRARGVAIDEPDIIARTGWSTDELAAAMDVGHFSPPYALVTLLIGVNNQYRGRDIANYRDEFDALLDRAVALAGDAARVIVVSIPDWGVTGFAHAQSRDAAKVGVDIDAYNAAARESSNERGVSFVDV
ncbi:MAG: GDSL-type esterase/lipase family protein, partial [Dokdonella sp.]